ncbi:hypothetical protein D3C76_1399220 [compost metagenome]
MLIELFRKRLDYSRSVRSLYRWPWFVCRQLQYWKLTLEFAEPIILVIVQNFPRQILSLPRCKIRILNIQRRQRRPFVMTECHICLLNFLHDDAQRPTITGNMVNVKQHEMLLRTQRNQITFYGPFAFKSEWNQ